MADRTNQSESRPFTGITLTPERRQYARYSVHVPLELRIEGNDVPIRMETTDLSRNGCYVENNMPLAVGTKIEAKLWLSGTRVVVRGCIVTAHPQYGNGIMFLEYEGDAMQRLKSFLDTLSAVPLQDSSPD